MSVNKPGLPKLNMQQKTLGSASFKTSTATKLASSTRTGYGISRIVAMSFCEPRS